MFDHRAAALLSDLSTRIRRARDAALELFDQDDLSYCDDLNQLASAVKYAPGFFGDFCFDSKVNLVNFKLTSFEPGSKASPRYNL